jgi:aconitase A
MGVLPLELKQPLPELLDFNKSIVIKDLEDIYPKKIILCSIGDHLFETVLRVDTDREIDYFKSGGILQYVQDKYFE